MKRAILLIVMTLGLIACASTGGAGASDASGSADSNSNAASAGGGEWISLFNGENLEGWRASENKDSFSVEDGRIVVSGPRSHLFYVGPVQNHEFEDFEFRAKVMAMPGSNSGIYFHTEYQEEGWPAQGYEAQINNTYEGDPRRTGSLYAVQDVHESPAEDNEWSDYYIRVQGDRIILKVNGETTAEYTEPDDVDREGRTLDSGTFALQGHDPDSTVYFKDIQVRPLE